MKSCYLDFFHQKSNIQIHDTVSYFIFYINYRNGNKIIEDFYSSVVLKECVFANRNDGELEKCTHKKDLNDLKSQRIYITLLLVL